MIAYVLMPAVFLIGILMIAMEDKIRVNKAAVSVLMSVILWGLLLLANENLFLANPSAEFNNLIEKFSTEVAHLTFFERVIAFIDLAVKHHLGDVATTLFFVMASMVIVNLVDEHGGFKVLSRNIVTRFPRTLLWIFVGITFFQSALLGNLATVIIIIAILRKIITDRETRLLYSCMVIIAANAGGSWSPIGDVTTLLLWGGKQLTAGYQITHVFPASIAMCLVPLIGATFMLPKNEFARAHDTHAGVRAATDNYVVFLIGVIALAIVPVFKSWLELPPFMTVLLGLSILWIYTDRKYHGATDEHLAELRVDKTLTRIDMSTILFFLGILMSVAALNTAGQLGDFAKFLTAQIPQPTMISFVLGVCSSFLDNVALVAAAQGMYQVAESGAFAQNGNFWVFLAYCAVTGGSILIIGSAAGVTVMGMEKIGFMYYLKKFTPLVLAGYCAGAGVFLLMN